MKVKKVFNLLYKPLRNKTKNNVQALLSPIDKYDPNNITIEEFRAYVRYLADNKINKTFIEPVKFITETERAQKKAFEDKIRYLAENNINLTFYC